MLSHTAAQPVSAVLQIPELSGSRPLSVHFRSSKKALGKLSKGHPDAQDSPALPVHRCKAASLALIRPLVWRRQLLCTLVLLHSKYGLGRILCCGTHYSQLWGPA